MKVFVHGGCVSRDMLEFQTDPRFFELACYSARSSLASLSLEKIKSRLDLSELTSKFQIRMLENDHQRDLLKKLESIDFDIFLIDFNVERYDLVNINDLGYVTNSSEFSKLKLNGNKKITKKISAYSDLHFDKFMIGFEKIYRIISEKGLSDRIFIKKLYWTDTDEAGNQLVKYLDQIKKVNGKFDRIYNALTRKYPRLNFIEFDPAVLIANSNHKWGLAPYHYIDKLYLNALSSIKNIILNQQEIKVKNLIAMNGVINGELAIISKELDLQFAAYLYKDGIVLEKKWYQNNSQFIFNVSEVGSYKIRFFVRIRGTDIKRTLNSKVIDVI